jgi:hypothetical protein
MGQFQIERERLQLRNLHYWVTLGGLSFIFLPAVRIFSLEFLFIGIILIAAGFSVYILLSLLRLGKKGWIIAYAIIIGFSCLLALILSKSEIIGAGIWLLPLVMFYFYCWILRYSITDWLSDVGDEKAFRLDQKDENPYQNVLKRFK